MEGTGEGELPRFLDEVTHEWAVANLRFLQAVFGEFDCDADWPQINVLQRRLNRRGERLNVSDAAYHIPPNLGHLEASLGLSSAGDQQIVLSPFALRYVDEAGGVLQDFTAFLRLVVSRYLSADDQDEVVVRRSDLQELGLSDSRALKLSHIILRGGVHFLAGGVTDIEAWERTIHEPGLFPLLDVTDIDGYLSAEGVLSTASPTVANPLLDERAASSSAPSELPANLHPEIAKACVTLFQTEHFPEAVEKSYKVVRDRLRELTGYETGSEAFGRGGLQVSGAAAPHVAEDFNQAVKFLTMAIDRFRNEKSHSSDGHIGDPDRAREYISMSSLAMHLLDRAEAPS